MLCVPLYVPLVPHVFCSSMDRLKRERSAKRTGTAVCVARRRGERLAQPGQLEGILELQASRSDKHAASQAFARTHTHVSLLKNILPVCWRCSHCSVRMFTNSDESTDGWNGKTQCTNMKTECDISHQEHNRYAIVLCGQTHRVQRFVAIVIKYKEAELHALLQAVQGCII